MPSSLPRVLAGASALLLIPLFLRAVGSSPDELPAETGVKPATARAVVEVAVDIRCEGEGVQFSLSPWNVRLRQDDEVAWVLSETSTVDSITIAAKRPGSWPFARNPPYRGGKGNPARGREMRPNQPPGRSYAYNVEATCRNADGTVKSVVVDPDMIIME